MNSTRYFNKIIKIFINVENVRIYNDRIRNACSNYFLTVLMEFRVWNYILTLWVNLYIHREYQ